MGTPHQKLKRTLSKTEKEALEACRCGADVFTPSLAMCLRRIEKKRPDLIRIGKPAGVYGPFDQRPYFGAIITIKGKDYLNKQNEKST